MTQPGLTEEEYLEAELEFIRTLAGMDARYDEMKEEFTCVIHGKQDSEDCPRC